MTTRETTLAALIVAAALLSGCRIGEGLDPAGARCLGVTCASPPPTVCLAPGFQRESQPRGKCQLDTGLCEYSYVETGCPLGCFESKRCRREGDELARVRVTRWAMTPESSAVLVDPVPAPGCDAGVFEVRGARLPGLSPGAPRWSGCREGWATEKLAWPMVGPDGVVIGFEGLTGNILAWTGGVRLLGADGGVRVAPRLGRPAFALDEDGGLFWAALDVAVALTPDGRERWSRPCPGLCGSKLEPWTGQPLALVIPGRAFVSCHAGCAAFTPEGAPLLALPRDGGWFTDLLLTDSPERVLVSPSTGGLEALPLSGSDAGRVRFEGPAASRAVAAVVEQGGTVLLASWGAAASPGTGMAGSLSRLEPASLTEVMRVSVSCQPTGLVARRDGSTLLAVWCRDDAVEPGPGIWVLDPSLEVTARLRPSGYSRTIGPLSVDEEGNIWVTLDGTLVVMTGTQPPAQSPWPMVRADAQNSSRAHLVP